ncbi:hypothetical protein D3C71_78650 [compost metagenome]
MRRLKPTPQLALEQHEEPLVNDDATVVDVVVDDEIADELAAGELLGEQTEEAGAAVDALNDIHGALSEATTSGEISDSAVKIAQVAAEHFFAVVGYASPAPVALESANAGRLVMESIADGAKKIWAKIIAALKKALAWVKGIWAKLTARGKQASAMAEEVTKKADAAARGEPPEDVVKAQTVDKDDVQTKAWTEKMSQHEPIKPRQPSAASSPMAAQHRVEEIKRKLQELGAGTDKGKEHDLGYMLALTTRLSKNMMLGTGQLQRDAQELAHYAAEPFLLRYSPHGRILAFQLTQKVSDTERETSVLPLHKKVSCTLGAAVDGPEAVYQYLNVPHLVNASPRVETNGEIQHRSESDVKALADSAKALIEIGERYGDIQGKIEGATRDLIKKAEASMSGSTPNNSEEAKAQRAIISAGANWLMKPSAEFADYTFSAGMKILALCTLLIADNYAKA